MSKWQSTIFIILFFLLSHTFGYPGEIIYGCIPAEKPWTGPYKPWAGENTKNSYAHLTFDDGPDVNVTPVILDVLKEYNISATFFVITNQINADTQPILQRMIEEGHTIGSHSHWHKNLQYMNLTLIKEEVELADAVLTPILGEKPKLFRPPFGSMSAQVNNYLTEQGYTIILWSAGCVDWWFTDHNISLDTSNAAMRYGLAEEGGIVCMHDRSEAPNDGQRLKYFLDSIWNYWDFVDFHTCIGRDDVDIVPYTINVLNDKKYNVWFTIGIIFISLFVVSLIVIIILAYLYYVSNRNALIKHQMSTDNDIEAE
eukprot:709828_1